MIEESGWLIIPPDFLRLCRRCEYEAGHTLQVTRLALRLFDELAGLHGLGPAERRLLMAGALFHDLGWVNGGPGHHKASYDIVTECRPESLSIREAEVAGLVARYHRKAPPSKDHGPFRELEPEDQEIVRKLAAILRIADGLDRGHTGVVEDLTCTFGAYGVTILLRTNGPADLEVWGARRKAGLFEDVFGRSVDIRAV